MIPIQISRMGFIGALAQKPERKCRFTYLSRATDERHLPSEGLSNRVLQVPWDMHEMDYTPLYS